jgi:hypothetical protein
MRCQIRGVELRRESLIRGVIEYAPTSITNEIVYAPLSTSSTQIRYAPLSSASSPSSPHGLISSSTRSILSLSHSTNRPATTSVTVSSGPLPTTPAAPAHAPQLYLQPSGPTVGLTIAVIMLLGTLMAMTVLLWLGECHDPGQPQQSKHLAGNVDAGQLAENPRPIGLGISLHRPVEEEKEIENIERSMSWLGRTIGRGVDFAVSKSQGGHVTSAEEGLLLAIRDGERTESEMETTSLSNSSRRC